MILTLYYFVVPQLLKEDDGCDLILTDMQMPLVDGAEFTRMAKTFYRKSEKVSPRIFFCSADYSRSLAEIADDAGAQGT
jgi:CheY-like chemotaxis protein